VNKDTITEIKHRAEEGRKELLDKAYKLIADGVVVHDLQQLYIRGNLVCGKGVEIDINVIIEGEVVLEDGVYIGASCILRNCKIGKNSSINPFSLVEDSIVGEKSFIGPYGRLRPGSSIANNVQVGNFVEIKNAKIASKCRINHLSFIGDADLAEGVTIGAGTITCNHNGIDINHTSIGKDAYVGSGCNLVAPLKINSKSTIASGSTITKDTPSNSLTLARSRQVVVEHWKGPKSRRKDTNKNIK
jgi:bifunctional UDP-N-acetylglucosamine pyrophosphorylase / glucosamine-1-phosphate N-acetyltransferase